MRLIQAEKTKNGIFFRKKTRSFQKIKRFWKKYPQKREKSFLRVQGEKSLECVNDQRRIVEDFVADAGRLATVVPVFFVVSFACCALS